MGISELHLPVQQPRERTHCPAASSMASGPASICQCGLSARYKDAFSLGRFFSSSLHLLSPPSLFCRGLVLPQVSASFYWPLQDPSSSQRSNYNVASKEN